MFLYEKSAAARAPYNRILSTLSDLTVSDLVRGLFPFNLAPVPLLRLRRHRHRHHHLLLGFPPDLAALLLAITAARDLRS